MTKVVTGGLRVKMFVIIVLGTYDLQNDPKLI